ncbi:MAG: hypothetical protein NTV49_07100 [Kiritimatiellaeota bacterium]|nr:hypothetical protein [Kiritimatiellota bacterium]
MDVLADETELEQFVLWRQADPQAHHGGRRSCRTVIGSQAAEAAWRKGEAFREGFKQQRPVFQKYPAG